MKIDVDQIKLLREKTGAGYIECKNALIKSEYKFKEAEKLIRKRGLAIIDSDVITKTDNGVICSYIHPGDRIGVLVEIKCKTDFVAKTKEFKKFAKEIAMQVAAMKPNYISRADVPLEEISKEVGFRIERLAKNGITEKDEEFQRLLDAEMDHWYAETCLLEQLYVRDNRKNVKDLLADLIAKMDETCRISRIKRWEIGQVRTSEMIEEKDIFKPSYAIWLLLILSFLFGFIIAGILI